LDANSLQSGSVLDAIQHVALLAVINALTTPNHWWVQWVVMGWGVGVFFHWLQISERFGLFGSKWEKEQVEKRLGRKL
jgi:hypothetical protein